MRLDPPRYNGGVHPDLIFAYKGKDSLISNKIMVHEKCLKKSSIFAVVLILCIFDCNFSNLITKGDALSLRAYLYSLRRDFMNYNYARPPNTLASSGYRPLVQMYSILHFFCRFFPRLTFFRLTMRRFGDFLAFFFFGVGLRFGFFRAGFLFPSLHPFESKSELNGCKETTI